MLHGGFLVVLDGLLGDGKSCGKGMDGSVSLVNGIIGSLVVLTVTVLVCC